MDFRVLGPIEVVGADGPAPLGGPKQRGVLAHLLIRANHLITTEALIDALWPDEPPEAPRTSLRAYVSNLRKALGPSRIESRAHGYLLRVDPDEVDALRFESLVRDARRLSGEPTRAAAVLHDALALWRGPAFADLDDLRSLQGEIARLEELRLFATEERIAAELAVGRHGELIVELESLVREHPLRERLWGDLMLARYRSGRQGEALAAFEDARSILAEELGIDPSPDLRRLHEQILRQDPALELQGKPLRGYRLLERIGEGAFGVVHRALQPQVGREVAIKSIHPELANDPEFVRRFELEAQLVARLEHPHIVPLYDYWRDADGAYLVMRFLRGGSLRTRLEKDGGGLAPDEVATLLSQIADALGAAHRQGIVHRDVKPENVLLDEEGRSYLTDFGIAKDLGESRATRSGALGTPAYLSPEQIQGAPVTISTDLYALGILLYEVITGRHPFPNGSLATLMQQHLHDPVPSVLLVRPELSSGVDEVIARTTAKDPTLRFADAPALAAAFRAALGTFATAPARMPALRVSNPYKGLRPFDESDAPDFFGRDALVARLVARLGEAVGGSRLLAAVGPSGSGKSSVVAAGLVPALRRGELEGSSRWFYAEMTPGAHPIEELEGALLRVAIDPPASLIEQLERDELGLLRAVKRVLPDDGSELVLVIDQLEELFTLTVDEQIRSQFLASIVAAVDDPNSRLRVIATLRADFYDRPLLYPGFGDLLGARTEAVTPLAPGELERAIAGPAERVGVAPEAALIAEMLADVADEPGALPLLQYALTELFEQREDRTMTLAAYHEIGGVSGALAKRADELFDDLDEPGRRACRQLFLHLVAPGEGTEDTRRRVKRTELDALEVDREAMDGVIDAFGRHRLLSFDRDPVTRGPTVELAHEALLRSWGRLRAWIDEARDDVRTHRRLAAATAEWETSSREPSFLLAGTRLGQFESWSDTSPLALGRAEREYLKASLDRRDAEEAAESDRIERERSLERRSVRRMRGLVAVLAAAALVAGTLTAVAVNRNVSTQRASRLATARELAGAALRTLDSDPQLAALLALESIETTAEDGIVAADAEFALRQTTPLFPVESLGDGPLLEVSLTPDLRRLAIVGESGPTAVWDFSAAQPGRRVFTVPAEVPAPRGCPNEATQAGERFPACDAVFHAALSPDGALLATGHGDRLVRVWNLESGGTELVLDLYTKLPPASDPAGELAPYVGFSPDGRYLWTLARYGDGIVWDASTGEEILRAPGHLRLGKNLFLGVPGDISFSRDSRFVAFEGLGTEVWDIDARERVLEDQDASYALPPASFTDEGTVTIGGGISSIGLDSVVPGVDVRDLPDAPTQQISDFDFSPDGTRFATASSDIRVWDLETTEHGTLGTGLGRVNALAWSPDSRYLAAGWDDGTVRIWDVDKEQVAITMPTASAAIVDVAFTPGGDRLAIASANGVVSLHVVDLGELIELARQRVSREFTDAECREYLHVPRCVMD